MANYAGHQLWLLTGERLGFTRDLYMAAPWCNVRFRSEAGVLSGKESRLCERMQSCCLVKVFAATAFGRLFLSCEAMSKAPEEQICTSVRAFVASGNRGGTGMLEFPASRKWNAAVCVLLGLWAVLFASTARSYEVSEQSISVPIDDPSGHHRVMSGYICQAAWRRKIQAGGNESWLVDSRSPTTRVAVG
jgi:hypothetical protein